MHLPLPRGKPEDLGKGGGGWGAQVATGFFLLGAVSGGGVCPHTQENSPPYLRIRGSRRSSRQAQSWRVLKKVALRLHVIGRIPQSGRDGWLDGPYAPWRDAVLAERGKSARRNSSFRFGVPRGERLRTEGNLEQSSTNREAQVFMQINLPTWGPLPLGHQISCGEATGRPSRVWKSVLRQGLRAPTSGSRPEKARDNRSPRYSVRRLESVSP